VSKEVERDIVMEAATLTTRNCNENDAWEESW
jgi:hypothetical protein